MDTVTPNDIAERVGVSGLTFRNWLREVKAEGHPELRGHVYRSRYRFTPAVARQLESEFRARSVSSRVRSDKVAARRRDVPPSADRQPGNHVGAANVPPLPRSFDLHGLTEVGVTGWRTWASLHTADYAGIPSTAGVYFIVREPVDAPVWVHPSPAGHFKGRDPSATAARLSAEWVPGAAVLYIGKASLRKRAGSRNGLGLRLSEFGRFGRGAPIGHWGGRFIWQVEGVFRACVAWHEITWSEDAREYEKRLMRRFGELHGGRRPFANLTD